MGTTLRQLARHVAELLAPELPAELLRSEPHSTDLRMELGGVPGVRVRVETMAPSRGPTIGCGVAISTVGLASETRPLYNEHPGQAPWIHHRTEPLYLRDEKTWSEGRSTEEVAAMVREHADRHWADWLARFRKQYAACTDFWNECIPNIPSSELFWLSGLPIVRRELRFPQPARCGRALTPAGDEFLFAMMGFADYIERWVDISSEPLATLREHAQTARATVAKVHEDAH